MTLLIRFAMVALPTSLIIAACGGSSTEPTASRAGQWEIGQIADGSGVLMTPVAETSQFVAFSDVEKPEGAAAGKTGCDAFSGVVEIGEGGGFEAGALMMTLMGCPGDLGEQERLITGNIAVALNNAATYEVDGFSLNLRDADGHTVLNAQRIPEPRP